MAIYTKNWIEKMLKLVILTNSGRLHRKRPAQKVSWADFLFGERATQGIIMVIVPIKTIHIGVFFFCSIVCDHRPYEDTAQPFNLLFDYKGGSTAEIAVINKDKFLVFDFIDKGHKIDFRGVVS
jgi:hypothetical protein